MKKQVEEVQVTKLGDFEDTILWMSCRFWMNDTSNALDLPQNFAEKVVSRYWGGLTPLQIEKMSVDANREKEYGWGNSERINNLISIQNEFNSEITFHPYTKCDEIEFLLIRMAIMYARGRQTIASASLPAEIIEERYAFLSEEQKNIIVNDLQSYLKQLSDNNMKPVFGHERIDNNTWQKFMTALDSTKHEKVELIDGEILTVFRTTSIRGTWCEEKRINEFAEEELIYPLNSYIKDPMREIFIPTEYIKRYL